MAFRKQGTITIYAEAVDALEKTVGLGIRFTNQALVPLYSTILIVTPDDRVVKKTMQIPVGAYNVHAVISVGADEYMISPNWSSCRLPTKQPVGVGIFLRPS